MIKRLGFTVIEFIIVIGIIFFIAAALLPALSRSRQMVKKRNAREVIYQLEVGIQTYAQDYGMYPAGTGNNCIALILALDNEAEGIYYCDWPEDMKDVDGNLKDPWGNKYYYDDEAPSEGVGISYKIWSDGPDEKPDTDDDITNW